MQEYIIKAKLLIISFLFTYLYPQQMIPVDGVVAAINDKIILKSDVVLNMQLSGVNLSQNTIILENIYNDFLEQMINDYVLLSAAERDTNIVIDDAMVDVRLNEYLDNLNLELGGQEQIEKAFGKSFREIKYYYQEEIYNSMLREMYIYTYLESSDVSRKEVELFYEQFSDSLGLMPALYNFSVIEHPVSVSETHKNNVYNLQQSLLDSIMSGVSFESLAKQFSDDVGTASMGGDQGYYNYGTLFPEFEEAAKQLSINEVSKPVLTPVGFHIVKLIDKNDSQLNTKHILKILKPSSEDFNKHLDIVNTIYKNTENDPGLFDSLAVEYKNQYKNQSGVYRNQTLLSLPDNIKAAVGGAREYSLIEPALSLDKKLYRLIYIDKITPSYKPTLENSWGAIETQTKNKKNSQLLIELIEKLKHNTFIKYYK